MRYFKEHSRVWLRLLLASMLVFGLLLSGCSGGSSGSDPDGGDDGGDDGGEAQTDSATGVATTGQGVIITSPGGAQLSVPVGAVPVTEDDEEGTITFSIEKADDVNVPVPAGMTLVTDVYRFGPSNTVFNTNVGVNLPVTQDTGENLVNLYRLNETDNTIELIGGAEEANAGSVSGESLHFSPLFGLGGPPNDEACGCARFSTTDSTPYRTRNIIIDQILSLDYAYQTAWVSENSSITLPSYQDSIGDRRDKPWYLPQGSYQVCVEYYKRDTQQGNPYLEGHQILDYALNVTSAWNYRETCEENSEYNGVRGHLRLDSVPTLLAGPCPGRWEPTHSIGTGDLQISLRWHSEDPVDLDLYVTDPDGNQLYYGNKSVPSGGSLDIDNQCSNYQNGRPENAFWTEAPNGEYKIQVKWYLGSCGTSVSNVQFEVRVVNKSQVRTYTGIINNGGARDIATVTVQ